MQNDLLVYTGGSLKKASKARGGKHVVFDLDETLGSFSDLYILYQCLNDISGNTIENTSLFVKQLLSLYPEFLRYGITTILQLLYHKKKKNMCDGIHIYTNNQCIPDTWTYFIIEFIEEYYSLPTLFGEVIRSFKIDGKIVDPRRTEQTKSIRDLMNCILIPRKTEICYVDDALHPKMKHRYLYYLQPKPYYHKLTKRAIIDRYLDSEFVDSTILKDQMYDWYNVKGYVLDSCSKNANDIETDINVSKKIMYHIREFFFYRAKHVKTRRLRKSPVSKTRRLHCKY